MKRSLLFISIVLLGLSSITAQQKSNLIIFAEDATPFYAIVNGIKQNGTPETNVKITGLTNPSNQVKIVFKNTDIPQIDKAIFFQEMNVEATMKIANTKKGYKLRYFGEVSMGQAAVDEAQATIVYHTTELPVKSPETTTTVVTEEVVTTISNVPTNSSTTLTTTETRGTTDSESVNVDVSIGGVDFNMSVDVDGEHDIASDTRAESSTYTSSTTTTTTTSSSSGGISNEFESVPVVYTEGYTGSIGCAIPSDNFSSIKSAIQNEPFSDQKMMVAKQATRDKCLTTAQVKELCRLFDFEDNRLQFAKYAYDRTYDIDNYYQVNSIFDFADSKTSLNAYVMSKSGNRGVTSPPVSTIYVTGYSGTIGCAIPSSNFSNVKSAIQNEAFGDDKIMVAKQATQGKCLTTAQVKELVQLFDFEEEKLDFAKYAYSRTYDIDNYYQLNSLFDFADSKKQLNNYIMSR